MIEAISNLYWVFSFKPTYIFIRQILQSLFVKSVALNNRNLWTDFPLIIQNYSQSDGQNDLNKYHILEAEVTVFSMVFLKMAHPEVDEHM